MKIIFNDATELPVQVAEEKGDYLHVKTISATPEQLRAIFEDPVKTKRMIVEERGKQDIKEGYTTFYRTEEYPGKIYGIVMYKPEKTPETRKEMQDAAITVAQIQAQSLTDEQALSVQAIYPEWSGDSIAYQVGYKVLHEGNLYKCLQEHTSQESWIPEVAHSLWAKVLITDSENIPEWEQPDSTNPYKKGDKVTYNGKTWISDADSNVWKPGEYGWREATA